MTIDHHVMRYLALLLVMVFVHACTTPGMQADVTSNARPPMDTLVTAQWLSEHIDDPDLVVLDCTVLVQPDETGAYQSVSGRAAYEAGHIPSAGFADLMTDLSDRDSPFLQAMPTPEQFAAAMGALGVGDDSRVVLYDATYSVWAARVWWMLRWIGFDNAALLDGGLRAWKAEGLPLSTEPATRAAKQLTAAPRPELIADRDEVLAAIGDDSVSVIDAMTEPHYRGDFTMYARPGHIAGASNISSLSLLDESGHYRSFDELDMLHDGDRNARAITYCGGGVAASSNAYVMHRLGFTDVAVYMGSLQEWTTDPANPMEIGER